MCGIIGYVGPQGTDVTTLLLEGLSKLEYRGYDSAGIAVLTSTGEMALHRQAGKIANLVVTEGDLFDDKGKVLETWVEGRRYVVQPSPEVESKPPVLT